MIRRHVSIDRSNCVCVCVCLQSSVGTTIVTYEKKKKYLTSRGQTDFARHGRPSPKVPATTAANYRAVHDGYYSGTMSCAHQSITRVIAVFAFARSL